jgi:hypothetical protein
MSPSVTDRAANTSAPIDFAADPEAVRVVADGERLAFGHRITLSTTLTAKESMGLLDGKSVVRRVDFPSRRSSGYSFACLKSDIERDHDHDHQTPCGWPADQ